MPPGSCASTRSGAIGRSSEITPFIISLKVPSPPHGDQTLVTGIDRFLRQLRRVIGRAGHRNVVVIDRAEMLFEFGPDLRPALAATALVRHRIDDDPGFHGDPRLRRQSRQLDVGGGYEATGKANYSQMQQMLRPRCGS